MDRDTYEMASRKFTHAVKLSDTAKDEFLEKLRNENKPVAELVARMLQADVTNAQIPFFDPPVRLDDTVDSDHLSLGRRSGDSYSGTRIAEYLLDEKIGQGGMGVVYRARDLNNDRDIAIKLVRTGAFANHEVIRRFRSERITAAQMSHPNIVPVHASGQGAGFEYYTMALLRGGTLRDLLNDGLPCQRVIAGHFIKIARAVQYAHQHGVVHRDLKPANILFTTDQQPMVTDFGVAKSLHSTSGNTATGQTMGTMAYMAPEQFESARDVRPAADVYSLGATLYESLTGQKVFACDALSSFYENVRNRMPRAPADLNANIDRGLSDICMKCLSKDADDRYLSCADFAQDLERYLQGERLSLERNTGWNTLSKVVAFRETHESLISQGATTWVLANGMFLHFLAFLIILTEQPVIALWSILVIWGTLSVGTSIRFHWQQYWQLSLLERQSGWILVAVNLATVFLFLIHGPLTQDANVSDFLGVYPPLSLMIGVAMFAHIGIHAGRWLFAGAFFFPLALLMCWNPVLAPLLFCISATAAGLLVHRDLRSGS